MTIDTNLRRVKLTQDGYYTIGDKNDAASLCSHCGKCEGCPIISHLKKVENLVKQIIRTCNAYEPVISFKPPLLGFSGQEVNTFRMGPATFERLVVGQSVGLVNTVDQKLFARARVTRIYRGDLKEMTEQHAHYNHLYIDKDKTIAQLELPKVLERMYGQGFVRRAEVFSVVYFKPILLDADLRLLA